MNMSIMETCLTSINENVFRTHINMIIINVHVTVITLKRLIYNTFIIVSQHTHVTHRYDV